MEGALAIFPAQRGLTWQMDPGMAQSPSVDLMVKNPNFPDDQFRTSVPLESSIRLLKELLHQTHPCKPALQKQKIIFGGKVLSDGDTLSSVLVQHDCTSPVTVHLVIQQEAASRAAARSPPPSTPFTSAPAEAEAPRRADDGMATGGAGPFLPPHMQQPPFVCAGYHYAWCDVGGQPYVFLVPSLYPNPWACAHSPLEAGGVGEFFPSHAPPMEASSAPGDQPEADAAAAREEVERGVDNAPDAHGAAADGAADVAAQPMEGARDSLQFALKLLLLVFMLGQDGDLEWLAIIGAAAVAIFIAHTPQFGHLVARLRVGQHLARQLPVYGRMEASDDEDAAPAQAPQASSVIRTEFRDAMLLVVAFFSSLVPGWQMRTGPLAYPGRGEARNELHAAEPEAMDGAGPQ